MKVLVTGGLGANGAFVLRELLARGVEPIVYDNRADFRLVSDIRDDFEFVPGEINDLARLTRILLERRVERVVHMAALIPPNSETDALRGFRVNGLGSVQVFEAARIARVQRVVYISSRGVYGEVPPVKGHPRFEPMTEEDRVNPITVYDVTKVASERMGINYQRQYGLEFVSFRFATNYGPGKLGRQGAADHLSTQCVLIENALAGEAVRVPQGREQQEDMIYNGDLAQAVALGVVTERLNHAVYNIGAGYLATLDDFAQAVRRVIPEADIEIGEGLDYLGMGIGYYCIFDIERARKDLGYEPRFDFEAGTRDYIATMERLGLKPVVTHWQS
jgi:UDP-glucose 4-epimerase